MKPKLVKNGKQAHLTRNARRAARALKRSACVVLSAAVLLASGTAQAQHRFIPRFDFGAMAQGMECAKGNESGCAAMRCATYDRLPLSSVTHMLHVSGVDAYRCIYNLHGQMFVVWVRESFGGCPATWVVER